MPTKLPDFIENRLFLILYFVCAKKLGLKIILSHDSKCATSDIIIPWETHIHKKWLPLFVRSKYIILVEIFPNLVKFVLDKKVR